MSASLLAAGGSGSQARLFLAPVRLCRRVQLWYRSGRVWESNEAQGQGILLRKENLQLLSWLEMLKT